MTIKDKVWNSLIEKVHELDETAAAIMYDALNGAQKDTLIAATENGPLWAGDVPSKSGRDDLQEMGFLVPVVVKGEDGYTAATYLGARVCKYGRKIDA